MSLIDGSRCSRIRSRPPLAVEQALDPHSPKPTSRCVPFPPAFPADFPASSPLVWPDRWAAQGRSRGLRASATEARLTGDGAAGRVNGWTLCGVLSTVGVTLVMAQVAGRPGPFGAPVATSSSGSPTVTGPRSVGSTAVRRVAERLRAIDGRPPPSSSDTTSSSGVNWPPRWASRRHCVGPTCGSCRSAHRDRSRLSAPPETEFRRHRRGLELGEDSRRSARCCHLRCPTPRTCRSRSPPQPWAEPVRRPGCRGRA
jgi:hypothetical protein